MRYVTCMGRTFKYSDAAWLVLVARRASGNLDAALDLGQDVGRTDNITDWNREDWQDELERLTKRA